MNEHPTPISTSSARSLFMSGPAGSGVTEAGQYLEQLSDNEFWRHAHQLAYRVLVAAQPQEYLTCNLSRGDCLIPLSELFEVVRPPHLIALLPTRPPWMPGIVAWRGETIAVIDLDAYLSGATQPLHHEGMLLITKQKTVPLGLLVPAIGQTVREQQAVPSASVPIEHIQRVAPWYLPAQAAFVQGLHAEALMLDVPALLTSALQYIETAAFNG